MKNRNLKTIAFILLSYFILRQSSKSYSIGSVGSAKKILDKLEFDIISPNSALYEDRLLEDLSNENLTNLKNAVGTPLNNWQYSDRIHEYLNKSMLPNAEPFTEKNKIGIGISYDYTLSELQDYNNGSIEAIVVYDFIKERVDIANPRFFF